MTRLEAWVRRAPATRWPLVLLALLLLFGLAGGITGCGGGADSSAPQPTVLATDTTIAQAGDATAGSAALLLALPGPVLQLPGPALVRVRLSGQLLQQAHYPADVQASVALQLPQPTGPSSAAASIAPLVGPPAPIALDYAVHLSLPAGTTPLQALLVVRATDPATGLPTAALARATAHVQWSVELLP